MKPPEENWKLLRTEVGIPAVFLNISSTKIPPKFGLLFSLSWIKRLGGTLQMDLTYATIPMFGGNTKRLYRENQFTYIISNAKNSTNHPIYAVDTEFGHASCR